MIFGFVNLAGVGAVKNRAQTIYEKQITEHCLCNKALRMVSTHSLVLPPTPRL